MKDGKDMINLLLRCVAPGFRNELRDCMGKRKINEWAKKLVANALPTMPSNFSFIKC